MAGSPIKCLKKAMIKLGKRIFNQDKPMFESVTVSMYNSNVRTFRPISGEEFETCILQESLITGQTNFVDCFRAIREQIQEKLEVDSHFSILFFSDGRDTSNF